MIKLVLAFVLPLSYLSPVFSQAKISVQVTNFSNNKGSCIICLYNSAAEFANNGTPVACATVAVNNKTTTTSFTSVAPGTYAILVIHDANNNRKFDTNFLGIPKEGYGASGNKLPFAAAPKFEDNKFTVIGGAALQSNIKLRYVF
jgi:uncharacterized protein (DUF2141 family)